MSAILFLLHVVGDILARGRAIVPTPTAVSNRVVSLQAVIFPSILVRALALQSALFARKLSLVTIEPWVATDVQGGVILNM